MTTEHHHHHHEEETRETSKYEQMFQKYNLHLHDELIQEAAKIILSEKVKENSTEAIKKLIFSCLEITSLKVTDNEESILKLTEKINRFADENLDFPHPAAICIYPRFASVASSSLEVDNMSVTCVCGGFPSSQTFPEVKTVETALSLKDGATEVDIVMSVGYFLSGDYEQVSDEIDEIKAICGEETTLKVILETGALQTAINIKKAALMAMYSGADFIKTSTGKIEPGATPAAVYTMCKAIKEYYEETGRKVGIKIAGGVRTVEDAIRYYTIVKETLEEEWLTPNWLRFGSSSLANNILSDIKGEKITYF